MRRVVIALIALALAGCHHELPKETGPLPQRGYLWQRDWTPAVTQALLEGEKHTDGTVVLGAEIVWEGKTARVIRATIAWEALAKAHKPCALAVRIAPYPGPFTTDDAPARAIVDTVKSLLEEARAHKVVLNEFQIDFDCAEKKLGEYRTWLRMLAPMVHPTRLVITTLPSWLDEAEFPALVREADGYVLQVHSVPTQEASRQASVCDPILARKWAEAASRLGMPFSVALPTYRCLAGYAPSGKLLGVAMDSVEPSWPPGTHVLDFSTNADEMAGLVQEWRTTRPAGMRELLWYRLPVGTDVRNWRWPTLAAVMEGRKPAHRMEVITDETNPIDLAIINTGEAEERPDGAVVVRWTGSAMVASDALPGWTLSQENEMATFTPTPGHRTSLSPGEKLSLGWLRFDKATALRTEIITHENTLH